ncbi:MAG: serine/threonine protein kinase [Kofleriaceae bacterium]|nr:serine/threonine protein kinase [Kofleriaceae bacterium]
MRDLVDELLHAKVKTRLFGGEHAPTLGRLSILDRLGAGAMGTVFAAYDPKLERKVAVKVLTSGAGASRVLAEARALAKLQHPNVVTIYDADELDGLVYIVMELAPGVPLRAWVGGRHGWRDVVRVMREAGTGIAAAHAAGLVHRDIKPDNILVGDDRARVVDFGLAYAQLSDDGASAGTPFYMAPEVLAGGAATEASDQFSFAVTLHEALYGRRPHGATSSATADTALQVGATNDAGAARASTGANGADTLSTAYRPRGPLSRQELVGELREAAAKAASAPRPAGSDVPALLHAVISRGLSADPAERFPSMHAFLDALERERKSRRTKLVAAIAAVGLVAGAAIGVAIYRRATDDPCGGGDAQIAKAWPPEVRQRVQQALAAAPWSAQTLAALDTKAEEWRTLHRRVCEATRVHGDQSDTLLDLRMRCLERARERFELLVGELAATTEAGPRAAAPGAVAELTIDVCEKLTEPGELALPLDAAQRTQAQAVERGLDRAAVLFSLGRYDAAKAQTATLEPALGTLSAPRLRATWLALAAAIEARTGDPAQARKQLDEAQLAAADAKAPELELDVWSRRLRNELFAGDRAKVLEWATFAKAAAKRVGRDGAEIDGIVGEALRGAGKYAAARASLELALESKDPLRPEQRAVIEMNLGSVQLATGDSAGALVTFQRARDRVLSAFGDRHPDLALYADKLAAAHRARGELRAARTLHDKSLELRTAAFGADDRSVATSLLYRAQTELEAGDLTGADKDATRAKAIREKIFGDKSARLGEVYETLADIALARGLPELAQQQYTQAQARDGHLELVARRAAAGAETSAADIAPVKPDEVLSVDRADALAARIAMLAVLPALADSAKTEAAALRAKVPPELDLAFQLAAGRALLRAGETATATEVLAAAAKHLPNEPSRTALAILVALAEASQDSQAARTAVSLYQAMPQLDRPGYDALWALSKQ